MDKIALFSLQGGTPQNVLLFVCHQINPVGNFLMKPVIKSLPIVKAWFGFQQLG